MLYNGKEITQEEFDSMMTKMQATEKLNKGIQEKFAALEEKAKEADKIGDLQKQIEAKDAALLKNKLETRVAQVSKYLAGKNNDASLLKKIGEYSDEDFALFAEGKTDSDILTKEEIDSAKDEIDSKKKEIESERDKIYKEVLKDLQQKKGDKVVPPSETGDSDEQEDEEGEFPPIDKLKEIYNLDDARYDKTPSMEVKAKKYLDRYNQALE